MEVYDNKECVIYGLLRKHNLMRLNNFIAQVFSRERPRLICGADVRR